MEQLSEVVDPQCGGTGKCPRCSGTGKLVEQIVQFRGYAYIWTGSEPLMLGDLCELPSYPYEAVVEGFGTDYDGELRSVVRLIRKSA